MAPTRNHGLESLDDNLLEDVFAYFNPKNLPPLEYLPALCALSRVSRRCRHHAQRLLFRDVRLTLGYSPEHDTAKMLDDDGVPVSAIDMPAYEASNTNKRRWELFERSIEEQPRLALYVRTADLCWPVHRNCNARVNRVLTKMRNLRELTLTLTFFDSPDTDKLHFIFWTVNEPFELNGYRPIFVQSDPLPHLRSVIFQNGFCLQDMINFMGCPKLQTLRATRLKGRQEVFAPFSLRSDRSNVMTVDLHGSHNHSITEESFKSMLSMTPRLRRLKCPAPGMSVSTTTATDIDMVGNFSPQTIGDCLKLVKGTLQELRLIAGRKRWPSHDGSRLDLTEFKSLRLIDLPSGCFFHSKGPRSDSANIYTCLPSSLEELEIEFELHSGLFFLPSELVAVDPSAGEELESWKYHWLLELARHKRARYPSLRRLAIWERVDMGNDTRVWFWYKTVAWEPPHALKKCFEDAEIELSVELRVPKEYYRNRQLNWSNEEHEMSLKRRHGGMYDEIGLPA